MSSSPFLQLPTSAWLASNDLAFAIRDRYPVSEGHTLIIPRREVATWFDATRDEQHAILDLIDVVKRTLDEGSRKPDGYNVGFNAGAAAGQTVMHLHVHVIPRYGGDMDDPRGGVRHVIPWKGNYLRGDPKALTTGGAAGPFFQQLAPLFHRAQRIAVVAAFVQDSGLQLLKPSIEDALGRGAEIRLITGDYLAITQAQALQRLWDWTTLEPERSNEAGPRGRFATHVVESASERPPRSFHPKSWRFEGEDFAIAYVGSSNVSHSALKTGVEWNLKVDRASDPRAYEEVASAFERLWNQARPLTQEWIDAYAERARRTTVALPPGEDTETAPEPLPPPHAIQKEALHSLRAARSEGRSRALVVLATGLGKTLLAAFDTKRFAEEQDHWPKILFLAHRAELLAQAADTFRRLFREHRPEARVTWCAGDRADTTGDFVLASVQKLGRPQLLSTLPRDAFDYIVVDEVHHADAPTYRRILAHLESRFLLGLTATPERADDGDITSLFDDFTAYRADLGRGIEEDRLVPFAYFGLKDEVDYAPENIPWRNRRFDPAALERAVQTQRRMEQLWTAWNEHRGTRTLIFCASIRHALFVREWLKAKGIKTAAVFAGGGSDDRAEALEALRAGTLEAICSVDVFNEGVDVPAVDRVVMLRPTESPIVFIQQLGRGLRKAEDKERLTVIDFVGNHRVFLYRLKTLLSLAGADRGSLERLLAEHELPELPEGCSIDIELEAVELLRMLVPTGATALERAYQALKTARGERPRIGELYRSGYNPAALRPRHDSWFDFVHQQGDLNEAETRIFERHGAFLRELEITPLTKSFKMVTLEVLLEADALTSGMDVRELARRSRALLQRSPELLKDLEGVRELGDARTTTEARWLSYWKSNPINALIGGNRGGHGSFQLEGDHFRPAFDVVPEDEATLAELTRELVDYQLARYRRRSTQDAAGDAFECKVLTNQRDPILKLPARTKRPDLPSGEQDVRLPNGAIWQFRLMKEFINVARPVGTQRNQLPDLLRQWFGLNAGQPGTETHVRFSKSPNGWQVEPVGAKVLALPPRGKIRAYPSLQVAAGAILGNTVGEPEPEEIILPTRHQGDDVFAVRATGDSMDGGAHPIRDGDWMILKPVRGAGLGAVLGRVTLIQTRDKQDGLGYQVKRLVQQGDIWTLHSDNPARPSYPATAETTPIAVVTEVVRPEVLAPAPGTVLTEDELPTAFGLQSSLQTGRIDGHLFLLVDQPTDFRAPDRLRHPLPTRFPGETAYVLAKSSEGSWYYCGVARWNDDDGLWAVPPMDHRTWRAFSGSRTASRTLPVEYKRRAQEFVTQFLLNHPPGTLVELDGHQVRIVGPAAQGGLRIDGGSGGLKPRTISLTDFGWALFAKDQAPVADEAAVNRLRYLEGTPRASTRWIDTGWAIGLVQLA